MTNRGYRYNNHRSFVCIEEGYIHQQPIRSIILNLGLGYKYPKGQVRSQCLFDPLFSKRWAVPHCLRAPWNVIGMQIHSAGIIGLISVSNESIQQSLLYYSNTEYGPLLIVHL